MLAMRNLACNERWQEGWKAIREQWSKKERLRQAEQATRPSSLEKRTSAEVPIPASQPEPVAVRELVSAVSLPSNEASELVPQAPTPAHGTKPAPTHPWRGRFLPRRSS